jgi:hypothetical protein
LNKLNQEKKMEKTAFLPFLSAGGRFTLRERILWRSGA